MPLPEGPPPIATGHPLFSKRVGALEDGKQLRDLLTNSSLSHRKAAVGQLQDAVHDLLLHLSRKRRGATHTSAASVKLERSRGPFVERLRKNAFEVRIGGGFLYVARVGGAALRCICVEHQRDGFP